MKGVGILFLKRKKAKGNIYYYLCSYDNKSPSNVKMNYRFGRKEVTVMKLRTWKGNFNEFPKELLEAGCNAEDLDRWLSKVEEVI